MEGVSVYFKVIEVQQEECKTIFSSTLNTFFSKKKMLLVKYMDAILMYY